MHLVLHTFITTSYIQKSLLIMLDLNTNDVSRLIPQARKSD